MTPPTRSFTQVFDDVVERHRAFFGRHPRAVLVYLELLRLARLTSDHTTRSPLDIPTIARAIVAHPKTLLRLLDALRVEGLVEPADPVEDDASWAARWSVRVRIVRSTGNPSSETTVETKEEEIMNAGAPNKYAGPCSVCNVVVLAGQGNLVANKPVHLDCVRRSAPSSSSSAAVETARPQRPPAPQPPGPSRPAGGPPDEFDLNDATLLVDLPAPDPRPGFDACEDLRKDIDSVAGTLDALRRVVAYGAARAVGTPQGSAWNATSIEAARLAGLLSATREQSQRLDQAVAALQHQHPQFDQDVWDEILPDVA